MAYDLVPGVDSNFKLPPAVLAALFASSEFLAARSPLGTSENMIKDASAARPTGITTVWWNTATLPTNWVSGDMWVQA